MKRVAAVVAGLLVFSAASLQPVEAQGGWTTLFDGKNMDAFNKVGDANWTIADGVLQADKGMGGYLVTKQPYTDFEIRAEFWVDTPANSGIFIRCTNPEKVGTDSAYEVNIFDTRPDQTYRTGAIVNVAKPSRVVNTGNKWSSFDITAKGSKMTVKIDGMTIAEGDDAAHPRGAIALQWGAGTVKFRNVRVRTL